MSNTGIKISASACAALWGSRAFAFDASPSLPIAGAYFPFWLICAFSGIISTILIRVILIRTGVDDVIPVRLLVYAAMATAIALGFARLLYGR
jgi:hypothetical protein